MTEKEQPKSEKALKLSQTSSETPRRPLPRVIDKNGA